MGNTEAQFFESHLIPYLQTSLDRQPKMPVATRTRYSDSAPDASASPPVHLGDDGKTVVVDEDDEDGSGSGSDDEDDASEDDEQEQEESNEDDDESDNSIDESDGSEVDSDDVSTHAATSRRKTAQGKARHQNEQSQTRPQPQASTSKSTMGSKPTSSSHLDPSIFQSYFKSHAAQPTQRSILKSSSSSRELTEEEEEEIKRARRQARREARLRAERKGGVVVGRDGRPMKRFKDGRTVVRALQGKGAAAVSDDAEVDDVDRLAAKRAERFRKRKLGLSGGAGGQAAAAGAALGGDKKAAAKTGDDDDDPLGLNDPAFQPGGEFAHLANLTGRKKRRRGGAGSGAAGAEKKQPGKQAQRGGGSAGVPKRSAQSGMPAFGFRRSG